MEHLSKEEQEQLRREDQRYLSGVSEQQLHKWESENQGQLPFTLPSERRAHEVEDQLFRYVLMDLVPGKITTSVDGKETKGFDLDNVKRTITKDNVMTRNEYELTPLHAVAKEAAGPEVIDYMVEMGADVNAENERGKSVLHYMLSYNSDFPAETLKANLLRLVHHGANVIQRHSRNSLIHCAFELDITITREVCNLLDWKVDLGKWASGNWKGLGRLRFYDNDRPEQLEEARQLYERVKVTRVKEEDEE